MTSRIAAILAVNVRPVSGAGNVTGTVAVAPSRLVSSAIGGRSTVTAGPPSASTSELGRHGEPAVGDDLEVEVVDRDG